MDSILDILAGLGWREGVLLGIVVLTIYFVIMVLRLLQLPRTSLYRDYEQAPAMRTPPPEFDAPPGSVLAGVWESPVEPRLAAEPSLMERAVERARNDTGEDDFASQLARKTVETEVRQLQEQLNQARSEISRLHEEVSQLQAAQKVSPLYNEAMALAVRGVDAAGVAGRCGISIAEAELVVALSQKPGAESSSAVADDLDDGASTYGRNGRY